MEELAEVRAMQGVVEEDVEPVVAHDSKQELAVHVFEGGAVGEEHCEGRLGVFLWGKIRNQERSVNDWME